MDLIIVPDEDDPGTALMMVDGAVNGWPTRFLLDSGAGMTSVAFDDHTAQFPVTGHKRTSGVFGTSVDELITVPSLTVGSIKKRDVQIGRSPPGAIDRASVLGMDLLKEFAWHFRFGQGRALPSKSPPGSVRTPGFDLYLDAKAHPYVRVMLEGTAYDAVWDTGAGVTIVDAGLRAARTEQFERIGASSGTDPSGSTMMTDMWMMSGLELGGERMPRHKVATVDLSHVNAGIDKPMHMILGFTTLVLADWLMDFPGKRWWLSQIRHE